MRAAIVALALVTGLAACGSSSGSDEASPTTADAPAADEATTTAPPSDDTTTTGAPSTTVAALDGLPSCQEILQQYADTFTMDDLAPTAALFRQWAPFMPDDVAAASISLAEAYEEAGDGSGLNMGDVDLSADATIFSDWTNDGCPAG